MCAREQRICRSKVRYLTGAAAGESAHEKNLATEFALMLVGYHCPWCGMYHLTKSRPNTAARKRVEKRRRRWLSDALERQRESA